MDHPSKLGMTHSFGTAGSELGLPLVFEDSPFFFLLARRSQILSLGGLEELSNMLVPAIMQSFVSSFVIVHTPRSKCFRMDVDIPKGFGFPTGMRK